MSTFADIKTKQLLLRPLSGAQLKALADTHPETPDYAACLEALAGNSRDGLWYTGWSILLKEAPETPIGLMHFDGPPSAGRVSFHCDIFPDYRGRGLAAQAAGGLLKWAFRQKDVYRITARTEDSYTRTLLDECSFIPDSEDTSVFVKDKGPSPALPILMCAGLVIGLAVGFTWKGGLWAGVIGVLMFAVLGLLADAKDRLVRRRALGEDAVRESAAPAQAALPAEEAARPSDAADGSSADSEKD